MVEIRKAGRQLSSVGKMSFSPGRGHPQEFTSKESGVDVWECAESRKKKKRFCPRAAGVGGAQLRSTDTRYIRYIRSAYMYTHSSQRSGGTRC